MLCGSMSLIQMALAALSVLLISTTYHMCGALRDAWVCCVQRAAVIFACSRGRGAAPALQLSMNAVIYVVRYVMHGVLRAARCSYVCMQ